MPSGRDFSIIPYIMDNDNDNIFWFLAGCIVGSGDSYIRPRDRWDVVAYAFAAVCAVTVIVLATL